MKTKTIKVIDRRTLVCQLDEESEITVADLEKTMQTFLSNHGSEQIKIKSAPSQQTKKVEKKNENIIDDDIVEYDEAFEGLF